jgi:hypothetical protein
MNKAYNNFVKWNNYVFIGVGSVLREVLGCVINLILNTVEAA